MQFRKLVLPEHLNDQGFLFGGYLLQWIDEFSYINVSLNHPGNRFVTIALDNVVFKHAINKGEVLRFDVEEIRLGNTSVEQEVKVYGERLSGDPELVLFHTKITFVSVTPDGGKQPIPQQ